MTDLSNKFLLCLGILGVVSIVMIYLARNFFYTRWGTVRKFSIIDIEFPSSARYYAYIMTSIKRSYKKGGVDSKTKGSLLAHIYFDFIFIFFAYLLIIILCLYVSEILNFEQRIFLHLMWFPVAAAILDFAENIIIIWTIYRPKLFIKAADNKVDEMTEDEINPNWIYYTYIWVVRLKFISAAIPLLATIMTIVYYVCFMNIEINECLVWCTILIFIVFFIFTNVGRKSTKDAISGDKKIDTQNT